MGYKIKSTGTTASSCGSTHHYPFLSQGFPGKSLGLSKLQVPRSKNGDPGGPPMTHGFWSIT